MDFNFELRPSDSPFVETVWRTQSERAGIFTSAAATNWEIVVTKYQGKTTFTVRGPETQASSAEGPADAEFFGIIFKVGTYMPHLPPGKVINRGDMTLPEVTNQSFWMLGMAWQLPTYDNADTFVARLVRDGLLTRDPVVEGVLQGHPQDYSIRTLRRRFLHVTGMPHKTIQQIERARRAVTLLQQGIPILDTVFEAGYFDQPHLTRSLKHFMGYTPAQILGDNEAVEMSLLYNTETL